MGVDAGKLISKVLDGSLADYINQNYSVFASSEKFDSGALVYYTVRFLPFTSDVSFGDVKLTVVVSTGDEIVHVSMSVDNGKSGNITALSKDEFFKVVGKFMEMLNVSDTILKRSL